MLFIIVMMHPKLCKVARLSIPTLYNSESWPAMGLMVQNLIGTDCNPGIGFNLLTFVYPF